QRQWVQCQHAAVHDEVRGKSADRQVGFAHDAPAGEAHVGVHFAPARGVEPLNRQQLVGGLLLRLAAFGLGRVAVGADQRREIAEVQYVRRQRGGEFGACAGGGVGGAAVQVAVADFSIEVV